ncbi:putative Dynactin, 150 kDa isoform [Diplogelasinospora grovesii]|uniref:Dynactin, 150 kDa isoform n=1 Tax=Diplogelasinospora grovesii TaxID=303347 RepID=A0AAN6S822_9PEZI|nr:putative Dynactin, 150 kDa isoform [Diplogelasinospora grovesii]
MSDLAVGQTIQLSDGRVATIRFVGQTHFSAGEWVGIELEDSSGKNDGSVQGQRYFDCAMGYGMFVRPTAITVLAQPAPPARPPSRPPSTKPTGAAKRPGRPSSMFSTTGSGRVGSGTGPSDPGLAKRMSLNAPSPSPVPKTSRPNSMTRSPTKSPTKQLSTAASSAAPSRTGTPSNAGTRPTIGGNRRASAAGSRTSMGPPPIPAAKTATRQVSASSVARPGAAPARTIGNRLSMAGRPGSGPTRPDSRRNMSAGSPPGNESGPARKPGERRISISPRNKSSDDEILSPQPRSPVQAKTMALEKLARGASPAAPKPTTTSAAPRPSLSAAAANKEIEDFKAKLRVLEKKRIEDREKLRHLEKIQGERDKFERIIQTLQIKYQPQQHENAELKRQLKEAEQRLYSIEEMQAEHESAMELATLDREMAEETAEVLKVELDALKQKAEELELEVEILREENAEFTKGMSPDERASTGWLQMERNNERLREALIRLRDLTQQQEEELRDQIKSLEEEVREFEQVKEQHALAKEKLAQTETAVEDLREQLNNALGAEDLIEQLTEQTMNQSEEIKELRSIIDDLENLKEINDELEINHVQNEKEMQEELDFKDSVIVEQARRAAQQEEALDDMEYTLSRFRELVTSLQSDLEDMRASHAVTEDESKQLDSRSRAMMDLNMKLQISASKAQVKTIDLELRRMEAQEAEQHLDIVKLFLPDSYQADRDSVLALLRFKRLAFKATILSGFIKERVNGQAHPGLEDDIFSGCEAIDKLTWVSTMCDRFVNSITHCSLDQFAKYEGALYELEPVERALNGWIDGLRRDDLKEKQCATELSRTIALMTHLGEVHIANDLESFADDVHMRASLMQSYLDSAAVAFNATKTMVQRVVVPAANEEEEADDDDELAQYFTKRADLVVSQTRSAKVIAGKIVRALEDLRARSLSVTPETMEAFEQCESVTRELADMARRIGRDLHQMLHEEGRTEPFTHVEVQDCVRRTAGNAFSSNETELFATYLGKLRIATSQVSDLAAISSDLGQTQEFDRSPTPWLLRSQELKALRTVPVDTEEELRRLKEEISDCRRAIAVREESLSTAHVKIETLESRMRDANAKASRIVDLEAQLEHMKQSAASLQEDIQKGDRELKVLEAERDKWKKIASDSRLVNVAGDETADGNKSGGGAGGTGTKAARQQERAVATAREMDALKNQIAALETAIRYYREDNRRARMTEQPSYDWLAEPLTRAPPLAETRRNLVVAEGKAVLGELVKLATSATFYDLGRLARDNEKEGGLIAWKPAKSTPQYHAAKQMEDYAAWKSWEDAVIKKSRVMITGTNNNNKGSPQREGKGKERRGGVLGETTGNARSPAAAAAARLQIRLPGNNGRNGKTAGGNNRNRGEVQIVGSREWEGLQGRFVL